MIALQWAIYYEDGKRFTNEDGEPDEAPFFGVVAIACEDGLWLARDRDGLIDYLHMPGMTKCVKMGRATNNYRYRTAAEWARHDTELPPDRTVEEGGDFYVWMGKE